MMPIPVISPVPVVLGPAPASAPRLLPPSEPEYADYTVSALDSPPASALGAAAAALPAPDPARAALDDIETAARTSEYHDFLWWDARLRVLRAAIER